MSKLNDIAAIRREDVAAFKAIHGLDNSKDYEHYFKEKIEKRTHMFGEPLNLLSAVLGHFETGKNLNSTLFLAAEFKRGSPSKGQIAVSENAEASPQAIKYAEAGAGLISVLTEEKHFNGNLDDLFSAKSAISNSKDFGNQNILLLRKDFIIDDFQIYESKAYGADTLLLIVAILSENDLIDFLNRSRSLGMEPLVEVANEKEMKIALKLGAKVIGVNNRDLHSFKVDMTTSCRMADIAKENGKLIDFRSNPMNKDGVVILALSGIKDRNDVIMYEEHCGVAGILVGETLMRAKDPIKVAKDLLGVCEKSASDVLVKICGVKDVETAVRTAQLGADFIGLNFVEKSPRFVSIEIAQAIVKKIKDFRENDYDVEFHLDDNPSLEKSAREIRLRAKKCRPLVVGVFQNATIEDMLRISNDTGIDMIQLHDTRVNLDRERELNKLTSKPLIRVVHIDVEDSSGEINFGDASSFRPGLAKSLLVDASVKNTFGGSGMSFDWKLLEQFRRLLVGTKDNETTIPVFLAGGLYPGNVQEASRVARNLSILGLDVSSGVEVDGQKGVKDMEKISNFIKLAKT